ncbi:ISAzo13-like element transposase-related protein [Actinopolymorpha pittospori]|uniref:ISAzo13-like element transposase-related protein n=1 Tax=Actinopolymorpha pittospori TaxID=648752 RepID=UPI0017894E70
MRECGLGKRGGRKTATAPPADFHHRLFSFISINWRGRPLTDYQVIVETIGATTTKTGFRVEAILDTNTYPTGEKITNAQMKTVPITHNDFHGEWNYTIHSRPIPEALQNNEARHGTTK